MNVSMNVSVLAVRWTEAPNSAQSNAINRHAGVAESTAARGQVMLS